VFIALLASWALARFSFEVPFSPSVGPVVLVYLIITALTMVIGLSNSRSILNNPPLEVLRQEA
jgi:putative ABC transport system permease protein